jgi:hypothetical protein
MAQSLHFAHKRIVEYTPCSGFHGNDGPEQLHNLLDTLDVEYTTKDDMAPEYDMEFEINKESLTKAIANLKKIDKGEKVEDIDIQDLCDNLDEASITLPETVELFQIMLDRSEKKDKWIYVKFY